METKFRAWVTVNSDENEMVYAYCYLNPVSNHFYAVDTTNERPDIGETLAVMQFTGLKDNNGVDIYEGDVVIYPLKDCDEKFYEDAYEVIYKTPMFKLKAIKSHIFKTGAEIHLNDLCEVIGNIHANPELLTKKESD